MSWTIPDLETARLRLRPLRRSDAPALLSVYGTREATRYLEITPLELEEEAEALIAMWEEGQSRRGAARWGLFFKEGGALAGTCGFNTILLNQYQGELSYDLAPSMWGQGLIPEAARAVLRFGFAELRLQRIQACVVPEGAQSMRVLEKLGFRREGVLRAAGFWKGRLWDKVVFSLLRTEWQEADAASGLAQPKPRL